MLVVAPLLLLLLPVCVCRWSVSKASDYYHDSTRWPGDHGARSGPNQVCFMWESSHLINLDLNHSPMLLKALNITGNNESSVSAGLMNTL